MPTRKPKLLEAGHTDEMYTPDYALNPLVPYLDDDWVVWECAYGSGALAGHLRDRGYRVVGRGEDFFGHVESGADVIVTNPPYSKKFEFLRRAYGLGMPFAFLLPLTALEGIKRGALYREHGVQLIIPNRRINFVTPRGGKSSWFATAWFTWGLGLERDLVFVELERD